MGSAGDSAGSASVAERSPGLRAVNLLPRRRRGGGAATLVDDLAAEGFRNVAVRSGLPLARYDADGIHAQFGELFTQVAKLSETHATPWGTAQAFVYRFCSRAPAARPGGRES